VDAYLGLERRTKPVPDLQAYLQAPQEPS
jgi:hypothetical protein